MNQYSGFFTALKKLPGLSKEEAVYDFTQGRTNSLRKLTVWEVQELTRNLSNLTMQQCSHSTMKPPTSSVLRTPSPKMEKEENRAANYPGGQKADKMRKVIIAIFRKRKLGVADAIAWAEKQGVKGVKKKFNDYTTGELYVLIGIAEKVLSDWEKGVRKQFSNLTM